MEYYDLVIYLLRVIGRFVFAFLLINLWRLYNLFASPALKLRNKNFILFFTIITIIGFLLLGLEYVLPIGIITIISIAFNVFLTFIFALYLYKEINIFSSRSESSEFKLYSKSMDDLIYSLKNSV